VGKTGGRLGFGMMGPAWWAGWWSFGGVWDRDGIGAAFVKRVDVFKYRYIYNQPEKVGGVLG